jgi:hypothetical protein
MFNLEDNILHLQFVIVMQHVFGIIRIHILHLFHDILHPCVLSQPYFWKSERMTLTLSKWGLRNSPGLLKF